MHTIYVAHVKCYPVFDTNITKPAKNISQNVCTLKFCMKTILIKKRPRVMDERITFQDVAETTFLRLTGGAAAAPLEFDDRASSSIMSTRFVTLHSGNG